MKASELRIGNIIAIDAVRLTGLNIIENHNKYICMVVEEMYKDKLLVHEFDDPSIKHVFDYQHILGCPLTEDWLIKSDLKKQPKELFKNAYYLGNGLFIFMDGPKPKVQAQTSGFMTFVEILEIDYVHTFQNFIYILTGNELTIKP